MIAIVRPSGELIRYCDDTDGEFGFHRRYGFISDAALEQRRALSKDWNTGHPNSTHSRDEWLFKFAVSAQQCRAVENCEVKADGNHRWRLQAAGVEYVLTSKQDWAKPELVIPKDESRLKEWMPLAAMLLMIATTAGYLMWPRPPVELSEQEKMEQALAEQKPVVIPQVKVVPPPKPVEHVANKSIQKNAKQTGAAAQQLGFLKLLGRKDLSKAVGGMPVAAPQTSPGAGRGGSQGSGGQLLTGLGQGLRKTTVGNTGVAGLGGIGNAGAGGGQGGFGDAYVSAGGSGGGKILSEGELGKEVELDGGLDKVVIQATIAKYLSQIRACYEKGLRKNPGLAGQVLMDFEISATGKLTYSKVRKTSLGNSEVENCVAVAMKSWQFPKPVGGTLVKVSYPFTFKPSNYM